MIGIQLGFEQCFTKTLVLNYNHGKVFQSQKAANFARRGRLKFLFESPVTLEHRRSDCGVFRAEKNNRHFRKGLSNEECQIVDNLGFAYGVLRWLRPDTKHRRKGRSIRGTGKRDKQ
jgi:hypothetical protein